MFYETSKTMLKNIRKCFPFFDKLRPKSKILDTVPCKWIYRLSKQNLRYLYAIVTGKWKIKNIWSKNRFLGVIIYH